MQPPPEIATHACINPLQAKNMRLDQSCCYILQLLPQDNSSQFTYCVVWCCALFKWGFWYLKMTCVGHKIKEDENLGWTIQNNKQRTEKVKKRTQAGRVEWSRESRMFTCCKRVFTFSYADATVSSWCSGRARKMVPTVLYCSLVSRFQNQYWDQHSNGVK